MECNNDNDSDGKVEKRKEKKKTCSRGSLLMEIFFNSDFNKSASLRVSYAAYISERIDQIKM